MSGGVLEPVVAREQLVVDRERRNPKHPELKGGLGRAPQRFLDQRVAGSADKSITVDSDPLTGLEHVRRDAHVAAVPECVAKCLERDFAPGADPGAASQPGRDRARSVPQESGLPLGLQHAAPRRVLHARREHPTMAPMCRRPLRRRPGLRSRLLCAPAPVRPARALQSRGCRISPVAAVTGALGSASRPLVRVRASVNGL